MFPPERIVCLTEETVETLYLLGEDRRIVGVSGYAVRPARVRREKPRVSAFISADVPKILALDPDLVLTFSDLQADIVAELIRHGVAVHAFNQRDVAGIFAMIRTLGALVGAADKAGRAGAFAGAAAGAGAAARRAIAAPAARLFRGMGRADDLRHRLGVGAGRSRRRHRRVQDLAGQKSAKDRIVTAEAVIAARPDIVIGSWCGKKFVPAKVRGAPGLRRHSGGARRLPARDQVDADPAARPGRADRRPRRAGNHRRGMGQPAGGAGGVTHLRRRM